MEQNKVNAIEKLAKSIESVSDSTYSLSSSIDTVAENMNNQ
jgi:uncharacterized protein YoxC